MNTVVITDVEFSLNSGHFKVMQGEITVNGKGGYLYVSKAPYESDWHVSLAFNGTPMHFTAAHKSRVFALDCAITSAMQAMIVYPQIFR